MYSLVYLQFDVPPPGGRRRKYIDLGECWISIHRRNMAGDPNTHIFNDVCVQLQNLRVKLLHSFAVTLLCMSMESRVNERNTTEQHFSIKML
jgi:hypothetical protein